jgi:hypothetical protein
MFASAPRVASGGGITGRQRRMMRDPLKSLAGCADVATLSCAVRELCAGFGKVIRIDVLTMAEAEQRRALCFLRLESADQEEQLMSSLGASRFGDDVLVIVDLPAARSARPVSRIKAG